mmetsp:Transcript_14739/g.16801  ORF Transcript_14739/g.16801 Transcript_14739/m.16801 type:complete len:191 (-) Transcript_14739:153-725(-)|eukprot:CAMPEP_0204843908 /NCGR_PEP_ID=MMETSP1346-20131115/48254_1 /ASSEMBLY_ACC=CAM_ASM_000771 /TAXON_ID=215587 /ORGANISM="Aplanochytrium stocchinoi, Strain GSBS06" /LENGTH=190 /DNA_ID=CAMNT_0051983131 /DNA_START=650 /DNA_END=1222 /DNA_ORIENTATION=-
MSVNRLSLNKKDHDLFAAALKAIEGDPVNISDQTCKDDGNTFKDRIQYDFIFSEKNAQKLLKQRNKNQKKTPPTGSGKFLRYTKEEEKALASASLHLDLVQIFVKNYLNVSRKTALKSAYTYYLQRPTHRSASALFRHSKELNRKKNRVKLIGVNKRKPFEKLCADLIQYLESTKIPVEQEELTESTRWR